MEFSLEPLRTTGLTNLEAGELIKTHISDIDTIDRELLTDAPFNGYVQDLKDLLVPYNLGLGQVQKSGATEPIRGADDDRDKAIGAFGLLFRLFALSDDPAEVEASRLLSIRFGSFKELRSLNYVAESNAIDNLVADLEGEVYAGLVTQLNAGRYVERLKTTNENFKTLFSSRMAGEVSSEDFDMKAIRNEVFTKYGEFCNYVVAMANALKTPLFVTALDQMNAARKYYSDLLARRTTRQEEEPQPAE